MPATTATISWPARMLVCVGLGLWLVVTYCGTQRILWRSPLVMPVTAFDDAIPFVPALAGVYLSLYPFLIVVPLSLVDTSMFWRFAAGIFLLGLVSSALFLTCPTRIVRPDMPTDDWLYQWLIECDDCTNACPSMHAALAIYSLSWAGTLWRGKHWGRLAKSVLAAWAIVILYATLATKQHVVWDLIAGAGLGRLVYYGARPERRG